MLVCAAPRPRLARNAEPCGRRFFVRPGEKPPLPPEIVRTTPADLARGEVPTVERLEGEEGVMYGDGDRGCDSCALLSVWLLS